MKKGIRIDEQLKNITLGKVYSDGSFGEYIKLYNDDNQIFQMEFLKGSDLAYTFLPECTELLEILKEGIIGMEMTMIYEELTEKGYIEK